LRKISAKGPYMVLEAFLLIHMGGSGMITNTESNIFCFSAPISPYNPSEITIKLNDLLEDNLHLFIEFRGKEIKPDTIINSDSIGLHKKSIVNSDSTHKAVVVPISPKKAIPEIRIATIIKPELNYELTKPEFALRSEQYYAGTLINNHSNTSENKRLNVTKSAIFRQAERLGFDDRIHPAKKTNELQDWFSIILLSSILLIAWIRSFFGRYFQQSLQSLYDFTLSARLFRNKNVLLPRVSFMLLINFILISSLFAYKSLEIFNLPFFKASFSNFILLAFLFLMLITFRLVSFHGLKMLFPRNQSFMEYHFQVQNFYKSIGLLILPILVFETYFPINNSKLFIWTGICIILILYGIRLLHGERIIKRMNYPLSYLLLYIVTFEILPISVCFKIYSGII